MRLKLRDSKKKPRAGWFLIDDGIKFEAEDIEGVIFQVIKYRAEYFKPLGDPEQEILQQLNETDPWMVEEDFNWKPEPELDESILDDVSTWMKSVYIDPGSFNTDKHSVLLNRQTCAKCKFNNTLYEHEEQYEKLRFVMSGGQVSENLGICDHFKWENNIAVLLKKPNKNVASPDCCWIK